MQDIKADLQPKKGLKHPKKEPAKGSNPFGSTKHLIII